jgi:HAD superfamily hydrolase (TIGR01450 family)
MISTSSLKIKLYGSLDEWLEDHLDELEAIIFDIDGVLIVENSPMPGSEELLDKLRRKQFPISLLTNDSNVSVEGKSLSLQKCGLEIHPEEIVSCGDGLVEFVQKHRFQGKSFFVMGDFGTPCFGEKAGLVITRDLKNLPSCTGVIVGEDNYDWESVINSVVNYFIERPESVLVVPNPDEYYPKTAGRIHIGAGGVARFMQKVLNRYGVSLEPVYLGKPYPSIFMHNHLQLEKKFGKTIDRRSVLMIGDHLEADIRGANDFGYRSALLLSGLTNAEHVGKSRVKPELLFRTL